MKTRLSIKVNCFRIITILAILLLTIKPSSSQEKLELVSGIKESINSTVLNEERIISIYLPDNYSSTSQKYPVLYLLDGRTHFQHATGAVNFLSNQGITPQMIIVSIHNIDRNRDFSPVHDKEVPTSGGADKFLNFVANELIQHINENYRASSFSILMGHSFGGTFAAYTLLSKPEVFTGFIAVSPYLQFADNYIVKKTVNQLKKSYDNHKYFYMTIGNEPDYFPALKEFAETFKEKPENGVDFEYVKMEKENHASIPYISVFNGLRFIFSEWQLPREVFEKDLKEIDNHYKHVSLLYDLEISTPENIINALGYRSLQNNDIDNAIEVFTENVKRYPNSANVYDSLGEAYENNNQLKLAAENYEKAYNLGKSTNDANTAIYQRNLERVQQK